MTMASGNLLCSGNTSSDVMKFNTDGPNSSSIVCCICCILQSESVEQHRDVLERSSAAAALAGLISFAALTSDSSGLGKHQLCLYDPGR